MTQTQIEELILANRLLERKVARLQTELAQARLELRQLKENDPLIDTMQHLALVEEDTGRDPRNNSGVFPSPWAAGRRVPR